MDKALSANMQKDTIERAIKRGCGALDGENYEEIRYEGYGPNGVAVMVECMTDNRNRTVAEVRHAFNKAGGNLGTDGSVAYLFKKLGVLSYPASCNEDDLVEAALEAGAQDIVTNDDGSFDVLTSPDDFLDVKAALEKANLKPEEADIIQRPDTYVSLDLDDAQKMLRLQDVLEDLDDVQQVHSNADISEEVLAQLG